MSRLTKIIAKNAAIVVLGVMVASCDCSTPLEITAIQKSDKKLACKDIILEINEAEHYRGEALESKKITIGKLFMPTCWVSGYVNGEQAMKTADARIDYLGHIYDLLDCGGMQGEVDEEGEQLPVLEKPRPRPSAAGPVPSQRTPEDDENTDTRRKPTMQLQKDEKGQYRPLTLPAK